MEQKREAKDVRPHSVGHKGFGSRQVDVAKDNHGACRGGIVAPVVGWHQRRVRVAWCTAAVAVNLFAKVLRVALFLDEKEKERRRKQSRL